MDKSKLSYFPETAHSYCYSLWVKYQFQFVISRNRTTKLGDYRFNPGTNVGKITVNIGLHPFQFLITYIHEVAHHVVTINSSRRPAPHGMEWKNAFRELLVPLQEQGVFPEELNLALYRHMKNPKASLGADIKLWHALNRYGQEELGGTLFDLPDETTFGYKNKTYKKLSTRRTRVLCKELITKKKYLIPGIVTVTSEEFLF